MKRFLTLVVLTTLVALSGCATRQGQNMVQGTALGAIAGAAIGDTRKAAQVGALVGLMAGASINNAGMGVGSTVYGQRHPASRPVTSLHPDLCPGGYRQYNGYWTCPGGQLISLPVRTGVQAPSTFLQQEGVTTIHVPSNCSIEGNLELQNLKGLSQAQCASVAKLASKKSTVPVTDQAPRDNVVRACRLRRNNSTEVLAVSIGDPKNPEWKVFPSSPGESCEEWSQRIQKLS